MKKIIFLILSVLFTANVLVGQPTKCFFAIHCDPNEPENFPMLEQFVDSADAYNVKFTIQFTAQWLDSILPFTNRMNTLKAWQLNGHEIAMHHHDITANTWDGYTNSPFVEIILEGKDTADYKGNMEDLYNAILPLCGDSALITAGIEDSTQLPMNIKYQNRGTFTADAFSNVLQFDYNSISYCQVRQGFISNSLKEADMEADYTSATGFEILGANTHVYNFGAEPLTFTKWFKFLNSNGIESLTMTQLMKQSGCGSTSSITENSNLSDQLYIYPNPSRGVIHFGSLNDASWNEYLLINSLGKVIQKGKFISGSLIVSVELPATGIYLLMVKDGRGKERSKKIVRL